MSESSTFQPIRNLIELCWPGEWGRDPIGDNSNCVVFRATDIDNDGHLNLEGGAVRDVLPLKIKSKALRRNDILLEASGGAPDKPVGRVALVASDPPRPSLTSNFFRFVRPTSGVDARYLMLQLIALNRSSAIWRYQQQTTGLINLKVNDYLDHKILVPTLPVQQKISDIIFGIDKAIEKTEALIAKYQQIKAGLMHDLFTRGVTADGKLRPPCEQAPELYRETPIGWIPKEWDACPIASLLDRIIDYRGKTPTKTIEGIPLITAKNVRMGFIDSEPREFIAERDYPTWMTRGIPINTDVVFTTEAPLGNVAQVGTNERVAFAQRVIILQPGLRVLPNFLRLLLMTESFQRLALRLSSGSTALGIKQSEFRKIMVGHPVRLDEQQFISDKLIALENYEAAEADKVEKLREQKLGLMSDLLTEKVRVLQ